MSNPSPRFTGIFIPVEILEIDSITTTEILLLSWIDALYSPEYGGCYASNGHLAERLKIEENTLAKSLVKLRKLGLIEDVPNPEKRVMKALIGKRVNDYQNISNGGFKSTGGGVDKNPPGGSPCASILSTDRKI